MDPVPTPRGYARSGLCLALRSAVHLAGRIVAAKALLLATLPVIGSHDGGLDVVRDRVVSVFRDFRQESVTVDQDLLVPGLFDHSLLERGTHPHVAADCPDVVEVEEDVRLPVTLDPVIPEDRPLREVLLPVPKLHVEASVDRLIVQLAIESLAVRHGAFPLGAAGGDVHGMLSA